MATTSLEGQVHARHSIEADWSAEEDTRRLLLADKIGRITRFRLRAIRKRWNWSTSEVRAGKAGEEETFREDPIEVRGLQEVTSRLVTHPYYINVQLVSEIEVV